MNAGELHVFTARFNPLRWLTPDRHYSDWVAHMLDSGVKLTVVECQYGDREFVCNLSPHVNHIGVRADSWVWSKENLLNLGIARVPEAKYICWADSDVFHRRASWAAETVEALQHYRIVQPWSDCYDLGPRDEHLQHHVSFCRQYLHGEPVVPSGSRFWTFAGGPYAYPHSGYCWATSRSVLDWTGGLFDLGGMGSGDHHQALALVGEVARSVPRGASPAYLGHLLRWQQRALVAVNRRIGYVAGTIEHRFHGAKENRGYLSRWSMFERHGFDPDADLKRNSSGVLEWAGNKPELEREWDLYLRSRREDDNCL
jgi:hypothetical protein